MEIKLTDEERKIRISSPESVFPIFKAIIERERGLDLYKEHFWVMGIHRSGLLMYVELVALGNSNRLFVSATDVFQMATNKGAGSIILAHNHPTGYLKFTQEDLKLSEYLIQVGKFMAIDVLDHIIITDQGFTSLKVMGLYDEMYHHPTCLNDHVRIEIERVQFRKKEREQYTALHEQHVKTAYEKGVAVNTIMEIFKLNLLEVSIILELDN